MITGKQNSTPVQTLKAIKTEEHHNTQLRKPVIVDKIEHHLYRHAATTVHQPRSYDDSAAEIAVGTYQVAVSER